MPAPNRLPEVYYRRRRVAAAGVLILVIFLVIWLMTLLGGNSEPTPAAVTSSAEASATADADAGKPSADASSSTDAADDSAKSETASSEPATSQAAPSEAPPSEPAATTEAAPVKNSCSLDDLIVTANSDRPSYGENGQPVFYMTVKNPTGADCTVDLAQDVMRFEVYDMETNRRVWSDVDCNPPVDNKKRVFAAGSETYYEANWSRTSSAPSACKDRQPVPAGAYYVHTLVGGNHSDAHPFNLR